MTNLDRRIFPLWASPRPVGIDIELTIRCNLHCPMCWFHGEQGIDHRSGSSELDTAEAIDLLDQVADDQPQLYFGGGEPLLREDFLTIASHAKSRGMAVSFTTNGTLMGSAAIEKILEAGMDEVSVSVDGPENVHDAQRGSGNFQRTVKNLSALLERRSAIGAAKPLVSLNITVTRFSVGHLRKTVALLRETTADRLDRYRIHHLWFITHSELEAHQRAVGKSLQASAPGAQSHVLRSLKPVDTLVLAEEISRLKDEQRVVFFPNLQEEEIPAYYSDGYRSGKGCKAPFRNVVIKPNGDVRFCPDEWIDDYVLGNIREDRLETIWRNEKAKRFRRALLWKGSWPGCHRCSWMHS